MQGAIQENIEVTYHDLDNGIDMNLACMSTVTNSLAKDMHLAHSLKKILKICIWLIH
jgi:hypothetical protein